MPRACEIRTDVRVKSPGAVVVSFGRLNDPSGEPPCHFVTFPLSGGTFWAATLVSPRGSPAKPSASGFAGDRRRKGVNGAFRPKGGNGVHGLFDDAGDVGCADRGVFVRQFHVFSAFAVLLSTKASLV